MDILNPQGQYYCSVGAKNAFGRDIVEEHLDHCLGAGINVEGINAEVATGQWEFQVFSKGAKDAGDQVWIARYLLERTAEKYVSLSTGTVNHWEQPTRMVPDARQLLKWSFKNCGSKDVYDKVCQAFSPFVKEHIAVYGADDHLRLTGKHETQSIDKFSYGVSDRGASIRIPIATVENGWKGWLEDRRPNSAADPYKVAARIITTVKTVPAYASANGR